MDCSEYVAVRVCIDKSWQRYGCCCHADQYTAQILGSDDGGTTWNYIVSNFGTCSWQNDRRYNITSWAARESDVRVKFYAYGRPGDICWWSIDNFCVQGILREVGNVAVISIEEPIDVLCVDYNYIPKVTVINAGEEPESFDVTCVITPYNYTGDPWTNTKHIENLAPGISYQAVFDGWTSLSPPAGKTDSIAFYITQKRNPNPSDDTIFVILTTWADVGIAENIWPDDVVYPDSAYCPTVKLENFTCGRTGGIPVYIAIEKEMVGTPPAVYYEFEEAPELQAGESGTFSFCEAWIPDKRDIGYTFTLRAWVDLQGDANIGNDTIEWKVECRRAGTMDAEAFSIDEPSIDTLEIGKDYNLKGTVRNVGTTLYVSFDVFYIITHNGKEIYNDQRYVADLASNSTEQVSFGDWRPEEEGEYKLMLVIFLMDDGNSENDTISETIWAKKVEGVEEISDRRVGFDVLHPNPFSEKIELSYAFPTDSKMNLGVYDLSGKLIKTLINRYLSSGYYSIIWDGKDSSGNRVPAGIYFVEFQTYDYKTTRKVVLLTR